ncbi:DNA cytosine methyltransferase [Kitasatospora purpeofusca]|uniref:DNA cytosine methyltransferase n=1 Tax=Kitasatospora purpeofusca TaxID=67352 RepID=UPI0030F15EC0
MRPDSRLRIGAVCNGTGSLDQAVVDVLGGSIRWHAEPDPHASVVLAHHWPDVVNHGDITTLDWSRVEPVDVLAGGTPCQGFSAAGHRRGMDDHRSGHVWRAFLTGVGALRPRLVLWENVATVRARILPIVVDHLAAAGYTARWTLLPASAIGAPHERPRLFLAALREETAPPGWFGERPHPHQRPGHDLLPTPKASDGPNGGPSQRDTKGIYYLPGAGVRLDHRWRYTNADGGLRDCAAAIARWEAVVGRPAPAPAAPGHNGQARLSPAFVEWMVGLPDGHVTDPALAIPRAEQLRLLGNIAMRQHAAAGYRHLLAAG